MSEYPQKSAIRTILFMFLFFLLPLVFSHVFSLVGIVIPGLPPGYERYKVYFLSGMVFLIGLTYFKSITARFFFTIFIAGISFLYCSFFRGNLLSDIIIGTPEKHHGILFFTALGGVFWILQKECSPKLQGQLMRSSISAAVLVSVYALLQYIGLDPVGLRYHQSGWDTERVFASLGNPNYLSGYLLLLLPMMGAFSREKRIFLRILFSLIIVLTGSVAGIVLAIGYFAWGFFQKYEKVRRVAVIGGVIFIIGGIFYLLLSHEKILSIETRFSLWYEALRIFFRDPGILIFGNGPDTISSYIASHKIILDPHYFPPSSVIDSFHNIIIDSTFFFGLPVTIFGLIFVVKRWGYLSLQSREGIILFFLFFSMNIPISVHFMLLIFYIVARGGKNLNNQEMKHGF